MTRRSAILRRQSVGAAHHSASPIDKNSTSVKNAGEGILSDSDSSPGSDIEDEEEETVGAQSTDEEILTLPAVPTPSPLSRLAQERHWTDQEEDEAPSPSPGSTDTESEEDSTSARRRPTLNKTRRGPTTRPKPRSRSSTLASLPAPPRMTPMPMNRGPQSSTKVITVAERTVQTPEQPIVVRDDVARDTSSRHRSGGRRENTHVANDVLASTKLVKVTVRREDIVAAHENQMLEYGWEALREAFEEFVIAVSTLFLL